MQNKIFDLNDKIISHEEYAKENEENLIIINNNIIDEKNYKKQTHSSNNEEMQNQYLLKTNMQNELKLELDKLTNNKKELKNNFNQNRSNFNNQITSLTEKNNLELIKKEDKIETFAEIVDKLQEDIAYNIEEIRLISSDKNNMLN